MYQRALQIADIAARKSVLLLGPRQTGKSTLLRAAFPSAPSYNLLDSSTYRSLSADPGRIVREVAALAPRPPVVVIDEVQRLPELLNEAHRLIEELGVRVVLTGSSARSLRRRGVNLLGGRARSLTMHPLVAAEVGDGFDLVRAVNQGLLPAIYDSADPDGDLADYAGTYLREEVAAEGLTRRMPSFARFLEVAALSSGTMLNATKIASDAEVKRTTVIDWFDVLRDTLVAADLPPWQRTRTRKPIATAKMYLFDPGVVRHLSGTGRVEPRSTEFGRGFEHLLHHELRAACDYGRASTLAYWRSTSGFKVDFIVDDAVAIEAKAKSAISAADLRGLRALKEEALLRRYVLVALVDRPQLVDGVEVLPWRDFVRQLWSGDLDGARRATT